jgi:hypothetical protein
MSQFIRLPQLKDPAPSVAMTSKACWVHEEHPQGCVTAPKRPVVNAGAGAGAPNKDVVFIRSTSSERPPLFLLRRLLSSERPPLYV